MHLIEDTSRLNVFNLILAELKAVEGRIALVSGSWIADRAQTFHGVQKPVSGRNLDAAALHYPTSGNPFFLTDTLVGEGRIPQKEQDAAWSRAARLSRPARDALEAAAVAGICIEACPLDQALGPGGAGIEERVSKGRLE